MILQISLSNVMCQHGRHSLIGIASRRRYKRLTATVRFGFDKPRRVGRVTMDRNLPGCERHADGCRRLKVGN
jgi:hypothetical protein